MLGMRCAALALLVLVAGQPAADPALEAVLAKPGVRVVRPPRPADAPVTGVALEKDVLTAAEVKELAKLKALRTVTAHPAALTDDLVKALADAGLLHKLDRCRGPQLQVPGGPDEVTELRLAAGDRLTDAGLKHFAPLKNLDRVQLAYEKATEAGLKELARLERLETLIVGFPLTDAGVAELKRLKKLSELWLTSAKAEVAVLGGLKDLPALRTVHLPQVTDDTLKVLAEAGCLHLLKEAQAADPATRPAGPAEVRTLDLSRGPNRLTAAGIRHLAALPGLEGLGPPGGFQATDDALEALARLKSLRHLNLTSTPITPAGYDTLATMSGLRGLALSNTALDDAGLKSLLKLTGLQRLVLSRTRLSAAGVRQLAGFRELKSLSLYGVPLDGEAMDAIAGLKSLETFLSNGKEIDDAAVAKLAACPALRELYLGGTSVTVKGLRALAPLNKTLTRVVLNAPFDDAYLAAAAEAGLLHTLSPFRAERYAAPRGPDDVVEISVATNVPFAVTDAGFRLLAAFKNVRHFRLTSPNRALTDASLKTLATFRDLESASLPGWQITAAGVKELAACKKLQRLELLGSALDDEALKALPGCAGLTALTLQGCTITDAGLEGVGRLAGLQHLVLLGSPVTDEGFKSLAGLKDLKSLDLRGTRTTPLGVAKLREALPNCGIIDAQGGF